MNIYICYFAEITVLLYYITIILHYYTWLSWQCYLSLRPHSIGLMAVDVPLPDDDDL